MLPVPHRAFLIARTEVIRSKRAIEDSSSRLIGILLSMLFGAVFGLAAIGGAFFFGRTITNNELTVVVVQSVAAGVFGFAAFMTAIRAVQKVSLPSNTDGLLTTVPHRDAVAGLLLAEAAKLIGIPAVIGIGVAIAFGIGAGSVPSVVLVAFALLSLAVLGVCIGFALGLVALVLLATTPVLARYRTPIAVLAFLAYIGVFLTGRWESVLAPFVRVIGASPLGWFGDLALLSVVSGADPVRAGGAVVIAVLGIPAVIGGCNWLAAQLWYIRPVKPGAAESEPSRMGGVSVVPVTRPMARVIRKTWLRALRSPIRLLYVPYPLLFLAFYFKDIVSTGTIPPTLPPLIALYGAWATGAAFTLNPIGDEEPVLPVTLTTPIRGRAFVSALCVAGLTIGLPVTVAAAVVTSVVSVLSVEAIVGVAVAAVVLCVGASTIAVGAGIAFPRLEAARVTRSREAVVPSLFAFALFSIVFLISGAPAMLGLLFGSGTLLLAGIGVTILFCGVAGGVSYYSAVKKFDEYHY